MCCPHKLVRFSTSCAEGVTFYVLHQKRRAHIPLAQKDVAALRRADLREAGRLKHGQCDAVGVIYVRDDLLE